MSFSPFSAPETSTQPHRPTLTRHPLGPFHGDRVRKQVQLQSTLMGTPEPHLTRAPLYSILSTHCISDKYSYFFIYDNLLIKKRALWLRDDFICHNAYMPPGKGCATELQLKQRRHFSHNSLKYSLRCTHFSMLIGTFNHPETRVMRHLIQIDTSYTLLQRQRGFMNVLFAM